MEELKQKENQNTSQNGLVFIKEVAKYFMDFLETDFHKRKNPKRNIQMRNSSNLLVGLNLGKYPNFNTLVWKTIAHGFNGNSLNTIQKGVYRTNIPKNLIDLIKLQIERVNPKQVANVINQISDEIEKLAMLHSKEYDQAFIASIESARKIIKSELVLPFISNLEKPLENLNLGDENNLYIMEEELTSILSALLEEKVSEILKLILSGEKVNISKQIKEVFDSKDIRSNLISFFEDFQVGDLFAEIYEMERNRTILDKQEFYLYFCDITFNNAKYPIFYIPFSIAKQDDVLNIEFDSQVYINKKALEYITQEYNEETNNHGNLQKIAERIIYLAQHKEDFGDAINEIINEIVNFFNLDKKIDLTDANHQVSKSFWTRISNSCYIALFDKSDEALVNDYEEILELLTSGDNFLAGIFNKLIDDFIHKNSSQSFNSEVESEWDNTETSDRLVFNSPIPLNSEQLQILSATKKDGCKYIVVEGPPGTGKSHTITAIIFDYILRNQSVLVLSDKKEALDVVEEKITETLNKVRDDKNFQNPILRLGKTSSAFRKILAAPAIQKIKNHLRAVNNNHSALDFDIEKIGNTLKEDLQAEIFTYEEIDINEIYELIDLEIYFEKKHFPFSAKEVENNPNSAEELEKIRFILLDLKNKLNEYDFDFDFQKNSVESSLLDAGSIIDFLEKFQENHKDYFQDPDIKSKAEILYKNNANLVFDNANILEIEKLLKETLSFVSIYDLFDIEKPRNFSDVEKLLKVLLFTKDLLGKLYSNLGSKLYELSMSASFSDFNHIHIQGFIDQYEKLKKPVMGYLFQGNKIKEINLKFQKIFNAEKIGAPQKFIEKLKDIKIIVSQINEFKKDIPDEIKTIDLIKTITSLMSNNDLQDEFKAILVAANKCQSAIENIKKSDLYKLFSPQTIDELNRIKIAKEIADSFAKYNAICAGFQGHKKTINEIGSFFHSGVILTEMECLRKYCQFLDIISKNIKSIEDVLCLLAKYPEISKMTNVNKTSVKSFVDNNFLKIDDLEYSKAIRFLILQNKIKKQFSNIPLLSYADQKRDIEELATAQMTYVLDSRVVKFSENSDSKVLGEIIRAKRKFPRDKFLKLKEAFPCILAGIRDYAEYIPLAPEIFDLVIIDEASQVSIAQAFPALLRAKKVLVLGDRKQFSNVKTSQARTTTNQEYLNSLRGVFTKCVSKEETKIVKLEKFNIKTSILEFFDFIADYNTLLRKHFRGYKEIISYSNKYFYQYNLQVMKIRGAAIDEVLHFSFIDHDGKEELIQNTNSLEAKFIISELQKLKEADRSSSVGIITPHTNQQKLLTEMINKLPEKDYFYEKLNLKIMTFDTCQGEERDIIFYSMVATEKNDHLWGIFIKDLSNVDIEEEGKIKAQRLNVGFSRAKECMHFVLSKPIEKYSGSIGEALRHYFYILNEAKKERNVEEVDKKSKMEPEVMNWFYQTDFWKNNKDNFEFIPQFELGKYLKQLDRNYDHPNYRVDFLLIYKDENHKDHKIIIEYDGFREHFQNIDEVNEFNYQDYYNDADVYREKILESYGYKFLRINKFNIGNDPITTLNERIGKLIKNGIGKSNNIIGHIHETIENLQNGKMKECPRCKKVKNIEEFKNPSLVSGYGRFCKDCRQTTLRKRRNRIRYTYFK